MKKLVTIIIVIAFALNSAGQGYALRPMASAIDQGQKPTSSFVSNHLSDAHTKTSSAGAIDEAASIKGITELIWEWNFKVYQLFSLILSPLSINVYLLER